MSIDYNKYSHIIYDPDYLKALLPLLEADFRDAFKTVKKQYNLSGSREKVLEQFKIIIKIADELSPYEPYVEKHDDK